MSTMPDSLVRFQSQLEDAIGRASRTGRRRTLAYRLGAVAATAAGIVAVLAAASLVTDRGPSVVDRAAAALATSGDTILHIRIRGERTDTDGTVTSWESEGWRATSEPFALRQVEIPSSGERVEWAFDGTLHSVYDARSNTIYEVTKAELGQRLDAAPVEKEKLAPTIQAKLAKKRAALGQAGQPGKDRADDKAEHADATHGQKSVGSFEEKFRDSVVEMLQSGEARVEGHVVVDGRDAIRIVSQANDAIYVVDARTYNPIEWRTVEPDGATTTLRFTAYEQLPGTEQNRALVSLKAQYPTASISHDAGAAASFFGLRDSHH